MSMESMDWWFNPDGDLIGEYYCRDTGSFCDFLNWCVASGTIFGCDPYCVVGGGSYDDLDLPLCDGDAGVDGGA
jgi:hypothetical protein